MRIIPAIDLQSGKVVRLFKGEFDQTTEYADNPLVIAQRYAALDVADLHIVDLDGARTGEQSNSDLVAAIARDTPLTLQLGGGIRDADTLERWFGLGVRRAVIGSLSVTDPDQVRAWMRQFGSDRIVLALDVRFEGETPVVTTHGWTESSGHSLWRCIDDYLEYGLQHVLCTDVSRDGAMAGPNVALYADIMTRYPSLQLQASGGVRDIKDLATLRDQGVPAAITGKAMLDGRISEQEISSFQQNA